MIEVLSRVFTEAACNVLKADQYKIDDSKRL